MSVVRVGVRDVVVFSIIPILAFVTFALYKGSDAIVTPDSPSYMYFGEVRTVGYPLFLQAVKLLTGSFATARYAQLAVLCISLGALALSFHALCGSIFLSLLLEVTLFANPGLMLLSGQIMSDCLSSACIAAFTAVVLLMLNTPRLWKNIALIAVTAAAMTVRPVNVGLVPAALLALLAFGGGRRWLQVLLLAVCVLGAHELTPAVHWLRHDPARIGDPLASGLFQKTLFRQWPQDTQSVKCDGALIAKDTLAADDYLDHVPADVKPYLISLYSNYLSYVVIIPEIVQAHHLDSFTQADPILMCYTRDRILSEPLRFLQDVADQFWHLITYYTFVTTAQHDMIEQYLAAYPPPLVAGVQRHDSDFLIRQNAIDELHLDPNVFVSAEVRFTAPHARPRILSLTMRIVQLAAVSVMALGLVALLHALITGKQLSSFRGSLFCAAGVLGAAFFGEAMIVCVVEIAAPRFIFPLWPLTCAALLLAFVAWVRPRGPAAAA